jgi:hypothetical protein
VSIGRRPRGHVDGSWSPIQLAGRGRSAGRGGAYRSGGRRGRSTEQPHRRLRRTLVLGAALVLVMCAGTIALGGQRIVAEEAAFSGPAAPNCEPSTLDRSALLPGTSLAVSPLPDSLDSSPETQISLLGVPSSEISQVRVSGSSSGAHPGKLEAYSQGDGASFVPSKPFQPGETVTVHGRLTAGGKSYPFAFHFTISVPDPIPHKPPGKPAPVKSAEVQHFQSRTDLQPPAIEVTTGKTANPAGYVFATPYSGPGQDGPMIFEDTGQLVWFHPVPRGTEATNLQVQQYEGQPVLTWWQGYIPPQGFGQGEEVIANSSYEEIAHVHAGNGFKADLHDFRIDSANDTALMTVFNPIHCNLTSVGGPRDGAVTDGVFQEIDLKTGLVRREWTSLDHVALSNSYSSPVSTNTEWPFDYFHINSVDRETTGNLLISARNTWSLYELNGQTGQITLSAGGKHSTIKMGSGTLTAYQHDATVLSDGLISIFDNGGVPTVHPQTRGIVVALNPQAKTETLVAEYEHPAALKAGSQGAIQVLADGNIFMGWGAEPYFSEFSASGQLLFDARMPPGDESYRGFRFTWTGTPPSPPAIAAKAASSKPGSPVTVYASWNGATEVASWRVLAGASKTQLAAVATAPRGGFETAITTPGPEAYVQVQALNAAGAVLGTSAAIKG